MGRLRRPRRCRPTYQASSCAAASRAAAAAAREACPQREGAVRCRRQHHEQHFVDFGREGLRLPAAQPRAAVNTAGAAAWLGQRERVQSLMQSHARWLRKLRHSIAHAE